MNFKYEQWKMEVKDVFESFSSIHNPIVIQGVLEKGYRDSKFMYYALLGYSAQLKEEGVEVTESQLASQADKNVAEYMSNVSIAIESYKRQTIVTFATQLEVITKNFVECFFYRNPSVMHRYCEDGRKDEGETNRNKDGKGRIALGEILKFRTRDAIIKNLARQAASTFMKLKWPTLLNDLEGVTKERIPEKERLLRMVLDRNQIVHENKKPKVTVQKIYRNFVAMEEFVAHCQRCVEKYA